MSLVVMCCVHCNKTA